MEVSTQTSIENLKSTDRVLQTEAYSTMMAATNEIVEWAYEIWDEPSTNRQPLGNMYRRFFCILALPYLSQYMLDLIRNDPYSCVDTLL